MDGEFVGIINFTALGNRGGGGQWAPVSPTFRMVSLRTEAFALLSSVVAKIKSCPEFAWLPHNPD